VIQIDLESLTYYKFYIT